ncbi:MAG: cyanophycinase [Bacteroidetes bacterium]|nr:cyanophycinase [Bacteroidota bacterium]
MPAPSGKLFIIGGGKRPPALVRSLIEASGIDTTGHAVILPMSSSEPDTAAYYAMRQFTDLGLSREKFRSIDFEKGQYSAAAVDSIRQATLIYITGGDQNKFMEVVSNSPVYDAIHEAYQKGATIAGTSAGAAVMSKQMITGNEYRHPEYTGDFRTIESENMEIDRGLGLLNSAIIDQHFIWRMRMNRLITVVLEHPEQIGIGIDESTAILVEKGRVATVHGGYQVIALRHPTADTSVQDSLLGGRGLRLDVLLPGDTLHLR